MDNLGEPAPTAHARAPRSANTLSIDELDRARVALAGARVIAVPTDTVYGLCVDPSVPGATRALFLVKQRPETVALPVMVADLAAALALADPTAHHALTHLGTRYWPGALTVVVPRASGFLADLGGSPATIGLRVSACAPLRALCRLVGPLAVSSANTHGSPPCTTVAELRSSFGEALVVVDGGRCAGSVSTVVDLTDGPPRLLRSGAIALEEIELALA